MKLQDEVTMYNDLMCRQRFEMLKLLIDQNGYAPILRDLQNIAETEETVTPGERGKALKLIANTLQELITTHQLLVNLEKVEWENIVSQFK